MTGSMYAGIAALKTHMQNLNVIGNNIANVNTAGYKAQTSVFRTALTTTLTGGSNGTTTTGGINPSQIGYGANMGSIRLDMSTGTFNLTGRATDCMIDGDGFFMVSTKDTMNNLDPTNPDSFKGLTLTRVGDFGFGPDNYLEDGNGNVVYGFMCIGVDADGNPIISDQLVPLRLPKVAVDGDGSNLIIYPTTDTSAGGTGRLADATSVKRDETTGEITGVNMGEDFDDLDYPQYDSLSIDQKTGKITMMTTDDQTVTIGYIAIGTVTNPNGVTMMSNSYYSCGEGAGNLSITMMGNAAQDVITTSDTKFTQFDFKEMSLDPLSDDYVGPDSTDLFKGMEYVNGSYATSNGVTTIPDRSLIGNGGMALATGGLEASKADLATEIAGMITTQRGYQANTKIVTVTDEMLETLINMKR